MMIGMVSWLCVLGRLGSGMVVFSVLVMLFVLVLLWIVCL